MKYLVTGAAGFIGMHTCLKLLNNDVEVLGIDSLNNYYDVKLKLARLKILKKYKKFKFCKMNINNAAQVKKIFKNFLPKHVIHLAAQAGVRYSIKNPLVYSHTKLLGFSNILEECRQHKVNHLIFASSSSVYGGNLKFPFKESDNVDHPISFYAATKKSNEMMAHAYSHMFNIPITGLRFFTVYGPWGRPDMSLFLFTKSIKKNLPIKIFNKGKMFRDFTYIDDIVNSVIKISKKPPLPTKGFTNNLLKPDVSLAPFKIFNIGSNRPINLMKYINIIEKTLNKKAKKNYLSMQKGDVKYTHANINSINSWIDFKPTTKLQTGIKLFVNWYNSFYK